MQAAGLGAPAPLPFSEGRTRSGSSSECARVFAASELARRPRGGDRARHDAPSARSRPASATGLGAASAVTDDPESGRTGR